MKTVRRRWAGLLLAMMSGCLMTALACAQSLQIIELQHRTAQEVIPVLQPLLERGGALSGQDYKLFVRASGGNVAQLREALAQIDKAPRQLLVSVRRASQAEMERERASASAAIAGSRGGVSVNRPPTAVDPAAAGQLTVRATNDASSSSANSVASVQVLEGSSAFIATGSSIPIVTAVAGGVGRRTWAATSTSYRDIASGFLVTPRVNGDTVVLDIEQRDESVHRGQISTQRLATQVSAWLGEWAQLGGVSESASTQARGVLNRTQQTRSDERSIWVKVEAR